MSWRIKSSGFGGNDFPHALSELGDGGCPQHRREIPVGRGEDDPSRIIFQ